MLSGLSFDVTISGHEFEKTNNGTCTITLDADSNDNKVEAYPHTHPFKNVPLKLMKDKDDVRKVAKRTTDKEIRTAAIPVIHEKKTAETGPSS